MMGYLAHPQGLGQSISQVENMTVSQMRFWMDRTIEINKSFDKQ
jgi:hypothetical protein|tara:strand:- start:176 stop:307 length:132 start_codon:yes stop_codon:yes gene_type:complete